MLKEQAGNSIELPFQANRKYLDHQSCEMIREVYQNLYRSNPDKFTYSFINSLGNTLNGVIHHLERLPEAAFKELIEVIDELREAHNELRLACFLFDVEEINPLYRLIMRNRAVMRGKHRMQKSLHVWPEGASQGMDDLLEAGKSRRV